MVGFVNYPRFPASPEDLFARALLFADHLTHGLGQWSALLVAPDKTVWLTDRPEDRT